MNLNVASMVRIQLFKLEDKNCLVLKSILLLRSSRYFTLSICFLWYEYKKLILLNYLIIFAKRKLKLWLYYYCKNYWNTTWHGYVLKIYFIEHHYVILDYISLNLSSFNKVSVGNRPMKGLFVYKDNFIFKHIWWIICFGNQDFMFVGIYYMYRFWISSIFKAAQYNGVLYQ